MRAPQQRIEHRCRVDVREGNAKMRSQLSMTCPQQKRLDMFALRRLLKSAHHRALSAMLGGMQDPQRLAAGPVAQQQRRANHLLSMFSAMYIQRPRHRRLDFRSLKEKLFVKFGVRREFLGLTRFI